MRCAFFFFNDTATTEIYTLSLHDALPISEEWTVVDRLARQAQAAYTGTAQALGDLHVPRPPESHWWDPILGRSEEHTSELQSRQYLVCRLLLEKKKNRNHSRRRLANMLAG